MLSGDKSGSGADVAVAKVATLSEHAFEAPRKGSDLNAALTAGGVMDRFARVASLPVLSPVSMSSGRDRAPHDVKQERIETRIGLLQEMLVRRVSHLCLLTAVIPTILIRLL